MDWNYIVTMDLGFDCTPTEDDDTAWDVADLAVDRINNFLSTEPEGSTAIQRFQSNTAELYMRVEIPTETVAAAGVLLTKLKNNLDTFPPLIANALPRFNFTAQGIPDV